MLKKIMYKAETTESPGIYYAVVTSIGKRTLVFFNGDVEVRDLIESENHCWFETFEEAKEYLLEILEYKMQTAHELWSRYNCQMGWMKVKEEASFLVDHID